MSAMQSPLKSMKAFELGIEMMSELLGVLHCASSSVVITNVERKSTISKVPGAAAVPRATLIPSFSD